MDNSKTGGYVAMKQLKKRQKKATVEAYASGPCGTPDDCIKECGGNILTLNDEARGFATAFSPD